MTSPLSYTHGTGEVPLLGDTIGRSLDRVIGAYPQREALVDVPSGAAGRTRSSARTSTGWPGRCSRAVSPRATGSASGR